MKKLPAYLIIVSIFLLTACDAWNVQPQPFPVWSPIPSQTPKIVSATPLILTNSFTQTPGIIVLTPITSTNSETPIPTLPATQALPSETPTIAPIQSVAVEILGCNTSIDVLHGMGEVTNAYVTVKNTGTTDLPNLCAQLRPIDEGRIHPDKTVCVNNLPIQNQVTLKLTVDSTYKQDTVIQVDASSNDVLLLRVDRPSCTDIVLFGGAPSDLGVIIPIQP